MISIVYGMWYFLLRKAPHQPKPTLTASSGFNLLPILFSVNISLTIYYTALTLLAPPTDSMHSNSSIFMPFNPSYIKFLTRSNIPLYYNPSVNSSKLINV